MSDPKGPKISRFLQKVKGQADDSKNLSCETLYISDYEYVNISTFALSDIKLWPGEDFRLKHTSPFIFIQIYSVEGSKLIHNVFV